MTEATFDPQFQESFNGPLTEAVCSRIGTWRPHTSWREIGDAIGFSGTFAQRIVEERGHIRTKHVAGLIAALKKAEQERDAERRRKGIITDAAPATDKTEPPGVSLEQLIHAIEDRGFHVTVELRYS
jgi:hypothetical protein